MKAKEIYLNLDAIKLALDTSTNLLSLPEFDGRESLLTEANIKSVNHTINEAQRKLREIINTTLGEVDYEQ